MWWFALVWGIGLLVALVWALAFVRAFRRRPPASQDVGGGAGSAAPRPETGVTAALLEVLQAREEGAPKPAAEPTLKLKRAMSGADQVEKLKQKSIRPSGNEVRQHEVTVLKAKLGASGSAAGTGPEQACHIVWSPGADGSRFLAKAQNGEGESIVSSSPPFNWDEPTAPPTSVPRAARAHAALVRELKEAGWKTTGRGQDWYSLELQRRPLVAVREGEA